MSDTRTRIVGATNELFRRRGYNGTALKDVTIAAEATTGSLYHFFPGGKVELTEATLRESGAAYLELFVSIAIEAGDIVTAVKAFFDGAADQLEETGFIDICPIGGVAREVASVDERLRRASADVFDSWLDSASYAFREAGLPDVEARALAATMVASIEGGFVLARTKRDGDVLRAIGMNVQALVRAAVDGTTSPPTSDERPWA